MPPPDRYFSAHVRDRQHHNDRYDRNDHNDRNDTNRSRQPPSNTLVSARGANSPFDNSNFRSSRRSRSGRSYDRNNRNNYRSHRPPRPPTFVKDEDRSGAGPSSSRNNPYPFTVDDQAGADLDCDYAPTREPLDRPGDHWARPRKRRNFVLGGAIPKYQNKEEFTDVDLYCTVCDVPFRTPSEKAAHEQSRAHVFSVDHMRRTMVDTREDGDPPPSTSATRTGQNAQLAPPSSNVPIRPNTQPTVSLKQRRANKSKILGYVESEINNFNLDKCPDSFREWAERSMTAAKAVADKENDHLVVDYVGKEIVYRYAIAKRFGLLYKTSWYREDSATGAELRIPEDEMENRAPPLEFSEDAMIAMEQKAAKAQSLRPEFAQSTDGSNSGRAEPSVLSSAASVAVGQRNWVRADSEISQLNPTTTLASDGPGPDFVPLSDAPTEDEEIPPYEPGVDFPMSEQARNLRQSINCDTDAIRRFYYARFSASQPPDAQEDKHDPERRKVLQKVLKLYSFICSQSEEDTFDLDYPTLSGRLREVIDTLTRLDTRLRIVRDCLRRLINTAIDYGKCSDVNGACVRLISTYKEDHDWNIGAEGQYLGHWLISLLFKSPIFTSNMLFLATQLRALPKGAMKVFGVSDAFQAFLSALTNNWTALINYYNNTLLHVAISKGRSKSILEGLVPFIRKRAVITIFSQLPGESTGRYLHNALPINTIIRFMGFEADITMEGDDMGLDNTIKLISNYSDNVWVDNVDSGRSAVVMAKNLSTEIQQNTEVNVELISQWTGGPFTIRAC